MNLGATKPPPASPPAMPKPLKKEPVIIDLTKDSDSEERGAQKSNERIENTFKRKLGLGQAAKYDSDQGSPSATSGSSDDDDFLRDESMQWELGDLDVWGAMEPDESSDGICSGKPPCSR
ncbi:hypothetical protein PIB30_069354 [Stylosanthes scabra]|uniref:Uncharacterized protein n=1 Tax=Stylosanthes scabra TaxID=79078 RepID=A0ABU6YM33_9FABA|nr:hypothetical protein [Stylosanthes scabra]